MPTQAISAYGISLWLGDGVPFAPIALSNVTATAPAVVTTVSPHGVAVGMVDVVQIVGVTGMTGINGTWPVESLTATTLRLRGSAPTGSYTGGGTVQVLNTWHKVAELTDLQDAGAGATLVEASAHDGSGWSSRIPTFLTGNTIRVMYNLIPTHYTHNGVSGFPYLLVSRARRQWMIVFPDTGKSMWTFEAFVAQQRDQAPVAGILGGSASLEMTEAPLLALGTG